MDELNDLNALDMGYELHVYTSLYAAHITIATARDGRETCITPTVHPNLQGRILDECDVVLVP